MTSVILKRWSTAALLLGLTVSKLSRAEPTANEIAVARQLFKDATDLEAQQQWAEAASKLRAALAIKDTPGLRFHLAHAEVEQGQFVEALIDYDRADELIRAGASAPDVADRLDDARRDARARVAMLTLHLQGTPDGAELTLDGKAVAHALLEQAIPLNPGTHHVEVRAPGRQPFTHEIQLTEAERRDLDVVLEPATTTAPIVSNPPAESPVRTADAGGERSAIRTVVIVGEAAIAVTGLAVGVGYSIAKSNASDRADGARAGLPPNACNPTILANNPSYASDCAALSAAVNDADRDQTIATIGFVGAGIAGVAALATGWLWRPVRATTTSQRSPVAISVVSSRSSVGVLARVSF